MLYPIDYGALHLIMERAKAKLRALEEERSDLEALITTVQLELLRRMASTNK